MNAYKIFTSLDLSEKMPLFPFSFMHGMMWCLLPQKWFKVMNPLVDKELEGKPLSDGHMDMVKKWKRNT